MEELYWGDRPMTAEDLEYQATHKYGWEDGNHPYEELQSVILDALNAQPGVEAVRVWTTGHNHYVFVRAGTPDWEAVLAACQKYWHEM